MRMQASALQRSESPQRREAGRNAGFSSLIYSVPLVFYARGYAPANMPLSLVYLQNLLDPEKQWPVYQFKTLRKVLMYGYH